MYCPICQNTKLSSAILYNTEVDYCPDCLGIWFDRDELRQAKDEKDKDLQWLDIDLWKNSHNFKVSRGIRVCPHCRMPLYEVYYGDSRDLPAGGRVVVDVCGICYGIWLDRAEFKRIIQWLKEKADYEIMNNYSKSLFEEFTEIFTGPETLREEILDFLTILKLFSYKFGGEHPWISRLLMKSPK